MSVKYRMRDYRHAQLSPLTTGKGDIDRLVDVDRWEIPHRVELRKDRIYWNFEEGRIGADRVRPEKGMLEAFLRLVDSPDKRIVEFARKYGPLNVCPDPSPVGLGFRRKRPWPGPPYIHCQGWELVSVWRSVAQKMFVLLKACADLVEGKRFPGPLPQEVHEVYAAMFVDEWLLLGRARPVVGWMAGERKPYVRLRGDGLIGALAVQLALAVGQSKGFAICYHCRNEYPPEERRPKTGQRNFCPTCQATGIPRLYASRDYEIRWAEKRRENRRERRKALNTREG